MPDRKPNASDASRPADPTSAAGVPGPAVGADAAGAGPAAGVPGQEGADAEAGVVAAHPHEGNGNGNGKQRVADPTPIGDGPPVDTNDPMGPEPTEQHDRLAAPVGDEEPPRLPFPVVGIGASAGGLEAFFEFFDAMPPDSGMAFVIVQHLPPDRESLLVELLARRTKMPVREIHDRMLVEPDHVYVIRPGRVLTIKDGLLHLGRPLNKGTRAGDRPVDDFFKSLAEEQRERAVAIVLSGAGSNGSAGAQAIKAVGGLCLAQTPATAGFPSMPRHVIDQGHADFILRPQEMPELLLRYVRHPYASGAAAAVQAAFRDQEAFGEVLAVLRTRVRQDFGGYKKPTVLRRIQRRMGLAQLFDMAQYARSLRQNPAEVQALADDLLIHVTGFFRDADAWESLRARVVEPLVAARQDEETVRCWVTACSSGEEAYSLAILLAEAADAADKVLDIKVFATDMAERSLGHARSGVFPGGIETEVSPERLDRFFEREDSVYRVRRELRDMVVFAPQNILQDPPFSRLDIATCRNLLIYLEPAVQQRLMGLLHFGLREGGALFLGTSETVGGAEDLFEPIDKRWRIYKRVGPARVSGLEFPASRPFAADRLGRDVTGPTRRPPAHRLTVPQLTEKALLDRYTPAAVAVDRDHRVLYYHGDTSPFLAQPRGEPTRDLLALAREDVRGAVRTALYGAMQSAGPTVARDGAIQTDVGVRRVSVTASPIEPTDTPNTFLVCFELRREAGPPLAPDGDGPLRDAAVLQGELARVRDELQSTIEELQTSNEELKASNEEVTSVNEELQSTNEELETSKEELQSLNEELTTVNAQLQAKMEEHEAASNDLGSLLGSTDIGVVFLDTRMRIRRYTPTTRDLLELIPSDMGRPLSDLARKFDDPHLLDDCRAVLDKLVPVERAVTSQSGRTYARRALPYRTTDNRIDGVVVTFVDVTDRHRAETALRRSETRFRGLVEPWAQAIWEADAAGAVVDDSPSWRAYTGQTQAQWLGEGWATAVHPDDREQGLQQWRTAMAAGTPVNAEFRLRGPDGGYRWTNVRAAPLRDAPDGPILKWVAMNVDVTARRQAEAALRASEEQFRRAIEDAPIPVIMQAQDGQVLQVSRTWTDLTGYALADVPTADAWLSRAYGPGADAVRGHMQELFGGSRRTPNVEFTLRTRDGADRQWSFSASAPGTLQDGRRYLVGMALDVTDRGHVEAALRESETRFRMVVAAARMGLWDWDVPAGTVAWEPVHNRMLGLPEDQTTGTPAQFMASVHPDDREMVGKRLAEAAARNVDFHAEFRALHPDGTVRWIVGYGRPMASDGGRVTRMIGGTLDVTDRKEAEAALREGRERFRMIVEGAHDFALILFDADGKVLAWNAGAEQITGWAEPEVLGRDAAILFTPEDRAAGAPADELSGALRDGRAADERWHVRKDGTRFWGSGVMHCLRRPDGGVRGFVKAFRDETDRKRDDESLQAAKDAAEAATQVKDEFLATLSHELRTPLSAILLWSKMLANRSPGDDPIQLKEGLTAIRNSAEAQKELIADLLDVSRITAGKLRLQVRAVELAPVVKDAVEAIGPTAEAKRVKVTANVVRDIGIVRADPERVRQIVWNLLTNAVKFTSAGGRVDVAVRRANDIVEFRVVDTGRGMDAAFLPHAFDRFRQAESPATRTEGGLGLGLAIVKQLVELHGGTVAADSAGLGKGSTFVVRLPLPRARRRPPTPGAGGPAVEPEVPEYDLTGVEVLLVEDDEDNRRAVAALLRNAGAVVTEAETAAAAFAAFERAHPDVVVSDIGLPGEDGYALLGRIRRREREANASAVPAIALTAFAGDHDRQRAADAGFQQHVGKPVEPEQLLASVRAAVAER